jgi:tetratricopeptide (TPR) repeat protein
MRISLSHNTEKILGGMILLLAVTGLYSGIGSHETIAFDDAIYVTDKPNVLKGLSWENTVWAFTNVDVANWHPLTWLSHIIDQNIFPKQYGLQILEGAVWHFLNGLLVWTLFRRFLDDGLLAWCVALVFLLHPLNVESVAWLSQRKNQLGLFFALLCLIVYFRGRERASIRWQLGVFGLFLCSLMSKAMAVGLPAVLFVFEWFKANHEAFDWKQLFQKVRPMLARLAPLFAASLVFCVITFWAQQNKGAVVETAFVPIKIRVLNAMASFATYIYQTFVPTEQAIFYPLNLDPKYFGAACGLILVIAGTSVVFLSRKELRSLLVLGWAWLLIGLLPVIGLVQVGRQSHADRYMYFPMLGLLLLTVLVVRDLMGRWSWLPRARVWLCALLIAFALGMGMQARAYLWYWQEENMAYQRSLDVCGASYPMMSNLAAEFIARAEPAKALVVASRAKEFYPTSSGVAYLVGQSYLNLKRWPEAEAEYLNALALDPYSCQAWLDLAMVRLAQRKKQEANEAWQTAWKEIQRQKIDRLTPNQQFSMLLLNDLFGAEGESVKPGGASPQP